MTGGGMTGGGMTGGGMTGGGMGGGGMTGHRGPIRAAEDAVLGGGTAGTAANATGRHHGAGLGGGTGGVGTGGGYSTNAAAGGVRPPAGQRIVGELSRNDIATVMMLTDLNLTRRRSREACWTRPRKSCDGSARTGEKGL